jgi:hypothetical protein
MHLCTLILFLMNLHVQRGNPTSGRMDDVSDVANESIEFIMNQSESQR